MIDEQAVLSRREVHQVLTRLALGRGWHVRQNEVIFRLTITAGLRASEIAGLNLGDLHLTGRRPYIHVRDEIAKKGHGGKIPIGQIDGDTVDVLIAWDTYRRVTMGAGDDDPVVCTLTAQQGGTRTFGGTRSRPGRRLTRQQIAQKWKVCVKCLGAERARELHTHSGRHTFVTYLTKMCDSRGNPMPLAWVQRVARHSSLTTTGQYMHVCPEDMERRGKLYGADPDD